MPTPRFAAASPPRPAPLAWGALAALLLGACGGTSPTPPPPPPVCDTPGVVTASQPWQQFGAAAWNPGCDTLTVLAPALASDERLALILVNAGSADDANLAITTTGTSALAAEGAGPVAVAAAAPPAAAEAAGPQPDRAAAEAGHALVVARREERVRRWLAEGAPRAASPVARASAASPSQVAPAVGEGRSFCVYSYTDDAVTKKPATLRHATTNALFYVANDRWAAFGDALAARPDLWASLESYFEGTALAVRNPTGARRIHPALLESFGPPSDVDGNGQLIFLLADLGSPAPEVFVSGYFDPGDVLFAADTTADCSGTGSNGADMLYLLDPARYKHYKPTTSYDVILDQELPGTMAHELQHDVFFSVRCLAAPRLNSCNTLSADLFLNEGLSMASEDFAGFGLHDATERARVASYLRLYQGFSLTTWPDGVGDPNGHYGGSHAFLRWHLDQAAQGNAAQPDSSAFSRALVASPLAARGALAAASGLTFEQGYDRFVTAALFSGESFSPQASWSFAAGEHWSPLHAAVGYASAWLIPRPGDPAGAYPSTLKGDGWGAHITRLGTGQEATIRIDRVRPANQVKPSVVVVRFKGTLPTR